MARAARDYIRYDSPQEREGLDLNSYVPGTATVFPYGLYSGEPFPVADYICGQHVPRSTESHYIIDRERQQHPNHFARFASYRLESCRLSSSRFVSRRFVLCASLRLHSSQS